MQSFNPIPSEFPVTSDEILEPNPVHSARLSLFRGEEEEEYGSFIGG